MKFLQKSAFIIVISVLVFTQGANAQDLLQNKISISASAQPLSVVMKRIEQEGGFVFSYNSELIDENKLVSLEARQQPVIVILHELFAQKFDYKQQNDHIIITRASVKNNLEIQGIVQDKETGEPVAYATVFERRQLVATMTNEQGLFRLQLKKRSDQDSLSISRVSYSDIIVRLPSDIDSTVKIRLTSINKELDSVIISMMEQHTRFPKSFLTPALIMNSLNLQNFF